MTSTYTTNGTYDIQNPNNYMPVIIACSSGGNSGNSGNSAYLPSGGGGGGASLTELSLADAPDRFKLIKVTITNETVIITTKSTSSASPNMTITLNKGGNSPNYGPAGGGSGGVGEITNHSSGDSATIVTGNKGEGVTSYYTPWQPAGGTAALNIGNHGKGASGTMPDERTGNMVPGNIINNPYVYIVLKQEQ